MNELHLFAGAGGGILGGMLLGHTCVCAVEIEPYCRKVLLQRQRDGILPKFPIWDDIKTFDGKAWHGKVDVVCGGFPCQDISCAGKGRGISGERSGLWKEMARVVCEIRPRYIFVENSPILIIRGLGTVLRDLAALGYNAKWCVLGAKDVGAPHKRERVWILADSNNQGLQGGLFGEITTNETKVVVAGCGEEIPNPKVQGLDWAKSTLDSCPNGCLTKFGEKREWEWPDEPDIPRVAYGVAYRVDRIKSIGNGQVPAVVKLAWEALRM